MATTAVQLPTNDVLEEKLKLLRSNVQELRSIVREKVNNDIDRTKNSGIRTFFIKSLTGDVCSIRINENLTVGHLKILIEKEMNQGLCGQRLIYYSRQLEDEECLRYIPTDTTIHLVLRLRGGMYDSSSGHIDLSKMTFQEQLRYSEINSLMEEIEFWTFLEKFEC